MIAGPYHGCQCCDSTCIGREICSVWREARMPDPVKPQEPPRVREKSYAKFVGKHPWGKRR